MTNERDDKRRDGREVEGSGLESRNVGDYVGGSNPSPSANPAHCRARALFEALLARKAVEDSDWEVMTEAERDHMEAAINEAFPIARSAELSFEQVRDAIVTRMGGHTYSLRDAPAVENFMALLAQVKREECALPSARSASGDTERLNWLLKNMDPVELDAVVNATPATADEARAAIDAAMSGADRTSEGNHG